MFTRLALAALTLAAVAAPVSAQTWKIDGAHSTARFTEADRLGFEAFVAVLERHTDFSAL